MVHALESCWRVLRPGGQLLDIRPTGEDRELRIFTDRQVYAAGLIDVSRGQADYQAADRAVAQVVGAGLFARGASRRFFITDYWDSWGEMLDHVETRWSDFATLPAETRAAGEAVVWNESHRTIRIGVRNRLKMVSYRKLPGGASPV